MDTKQLRKKYLSQKYRAIKNNIAWNFTFDTWLQVWLDSGKLDQRGSRSKEFCMARGKVLGEHDTGDYSPDNVWIITNYENTSASGKRFKMSCAHKEKLIESNQRRAGYTHTAATKEQMRQNAVGRSYREVTCPHCGKTGKESGLKSWHFNYCKQNPNKIERG